MLFNKVYNSFILSIVVLITCLSYSCKNDNSSGNLPENKILYPQGGELFIIGKTLNIKWIDNESKKVRIKLYKLGIKVFTICDSAINTGEYVWTIPGDLEVGDGYGFKIRIFSNSNDFLSFENQEAFKIIGNFEISSFIDSRDSKVYKTIKIGNQWWMAENFNYITESGSYCYNNDTNTCKEYGRLYTLEMAGKSHPKGWHLPTDMEWKNLELFLGISKAQLDMPGERGANIGTLIDIGGIGFNAKLTGYYQSVYNSFSQQVNVTYFWTATTGYGDYYWARLFKGGNGIIRSKMRVTDGLSVRYIKD